MDEVYDLLSAEKKFGDLSNFTKRTTIGLDDVKTSAIKDYNFCCEAFESSYSDYDEMEFRQSELSDEINLLESDIADIEGRIEVLETEKGELEEGSSAYHTVEYEISKLDANLTETITGGNYDTIVVDNDMFKFLEKRGLGSINNILFGYFVGNF